MTTIGAGALRRPGASLPLAARPANVALLGVAGMVAFGSAAALLVHLFGGGPDAQLLASTATSAGVAATTIVFTSQRFGFELGLPRWTPRDLLVGACASVGALMAAVLTLVLAQAALVPVAWPVVDGGTHFVALALLRVGVVPLVEEMLFRGVLMRSLGELLGERSGVVVQAVIFAIAHVRVFGGASG
ncbi:MAG: CPBP family intramembrane glutamic endopeptidase, partial [Acidimicrobiia bacterium]